MANIHEDGKLAFVTGGKSYTSPSSAGTAIIGTACNGWRFWSIEGAESTAPSSTKAGAAKTGPKRKAAPRATAKSKRTSRPKRTTKIIEPHKNQEDVPEGQVRWWCYGCLESFLGFTDQPSQCPNGHRIDDPELASAASADAVAADLPDDEAGMAEAMA